MNIFNYKDKTLQYSIFGKLFFLCVNSYENFNIVPVIFSAKVNRWLVDNANKDSINVQVTLLFGKYIYYHFCAVFITVYRILLYVAIKQKDWLSWFNF